MFFERMRLFVLEVPYQCEVAIFGNDNYLTFNPLISSPMARFSPLAMLSNIGPPSYSHAIIKFATHSASPRTLYSVESADISLWNIREHSSPARPIFIPTSSAVLVSAKTSGSNTED